MYTIKTMLDSLLQTILSWVGHAGAWGVFGASFIEELVSVIPSSMVQLGSGAALMHGHVFNLASFLRLFSMVVIPASFGVMIGSIPYVWISRKWGIHIIDRWGRYIGVSRDDIEKLKNKLNGTIADDVVFTLLRAFPVLPSVALAIYGGIIHMSWSRYLITTFLGVCIRATVLASVGWLFASQSSQVIKFFSQVEHVGLVLVVIIVGYLIYRIYKKAV